MRVLPLGLLLAAAGCWKPAPDEPPTAVPAEAPPRISPRHGVTLTYFIGKIDSGNNCSSQAWISPDLPSNATVKTSGGCGPGGGPTGEFECALVAHRGDADIYRVTLRYPLEGPTTRVETVEVEFRGARVKVFETDDYGIVLDPAAPWRP